MARGLGNFVHDGTDWQTGNTPCPRRAAEVIRRALLTATQISRCLAVTLTVPVRFFFDLHDPLAASIRSSVLPTTQRVVFCTLALVPGPGCFGAREFLLVFGLAAGIPVGGPSVGVWDSCREPAGYGARGHEVSVWVVCIR